MSIEKSPEWVHEQVRKGFDIGSRTSTRTAIDALSKETLIAFFGKYDNTPFLKNAGPKNSAAHIIACQKSLNFLGIPVDMDGWLGPKTINAIKTFQINYKLKGKNGIPGPETIGALKDALQKSLPKEEIIEDTGLKMAKKILEENGYVIQPDGTYKHENGAAISIDGKRADTTLPEGFSNENKKKNSIVIGRISQYLNSEGSK